MCLEGADVDQVGLPICLFASDSHGFGPVLTVSCVSKCFLQEQEFRPLDQQIGLIYIVGYIPGPPTTSDDTSGLKDICRSTNEFSICISGFRVAEPECVLRSIRYHHACAMGLEGIVAKRRDKPCRSGCSQCWIKVKNPNAPGSDQVIEA